MVSDVRGSSCTGVVSLEDRAEYVLTRVDIGEGSTCMGT